MTSHFLTRCFAVDQFGPLSIRAASWANPIEAQFGPLRTFTMGASNHPDHTVLARRLQAYLRWRNTPRPPS